MDKKRLLGIILCGFRFLTGTAGMADAAETPAPAAASASEGVIETAGPAVDDIYADLETYANALTIINAHYVEEKKARDLIYGSLKGMLNSLDPYSQFLNPAAYNEIKVETEGKFGGVGVEVTFREGILAVISPVDGTPAAEAGLMPGDKIVRIDGKSTRDLTLDDAVKLLRGRPGTSVTLTVLREGEGRLLDFPMKRAIINVKSVKQTRIIDDAGYVRLAEFQENTPRDLAAALKDLDARGIRGLILDLRNNPGGLLTVAVDVAGEFVPKGSLIVSTKGRTAEQEMQFVSNGIRERRPYPIVVLVNGGSASASEIVAGALKDHRLGVLLGTRTFGKGSVQTVVPLRDGSALRITTARYFTPGGHMIHGVGIDPDIEAPFEKPAAKPGEKTKKEKSVEIFDRVEKEKEKTAPEKEPAGADAGKPDFVPDSQILRAVDLIRALNVYGVGADAAPKKEN